MQNQQNQGNSIRHLRFNNFYLILIRDLSSFEIEDFTTEQMFLKLESLFEREIG